MTKKILTASAILAAAGLASAMCWTGAMSTESGDYFVNTELDNGTNTSGYWYNYGDDADGGQSTVTWPTDLGNEYSEDALDPVIDQCGGVCGDFSLNAGTITYDPFIGIGFNVAGTETETGGEAQPADVTSWGGICITYTSSSKATLELGLGDTRDGEIGYDNPFVSLPAQDSPAQVCKDWAMFKQAGWGKGKVTGPEAAAALASVKFKIQAKDGTSGSFNIVGVSSNDGAPCDGGSAIPQVRAASAVKAVLAGRMLSFSGIKSVASAEVMNLQGQVVAKGDVSSTAALDLTYIDAGVYMVRVAGKSVDFSQKIIVK
ncbi:MAG: T9SS type A sorting domain-containing protein [Fibrobacter sp.]|nr:T9SS type A sorting domain-containing protein [Fibrobacter sp.]